MSTSSPSHSSDRDWPRALAEALWQEHSSAAESLRCIGEMDAHELYVLKGRLSMLDYCLNYLHMDEDAASLRIEAARVARRFPALFDAIADGMLHLEAVVLLGPYLRDCNMEELVLAATWKSVPEIKRMLSDRAPRRARRTRSRGDAEGHRPA